MMRRGDVYWVSFDPSLAGEIKKTRPAIIVSNDFSNQNMNRVQVIPITSNVTKLYPCETYVVVNGQQSKAMADQIAMVSKTRLMRYISSLTTEELSQIERIIKIQLDLN